MEQIKKTFISSSQIVSLNVGKLFNKILITGFVYIMKQSEKKIQKCTSILVDIFCSDITFPGPIYSDKRKSIHYIGGC